jgi:hypothetical protein
MAELIWRENAMPKRECKQSLTDNGHFECEKNRVLMLNRIIYLIHEIKQKNTQVRRSLHTHQMK